MHLGRLTVLSRHQACHGQGCQRLWPTGGLHVQRLSLRHWLHPDGRLEQRQNLRLGPDLLRRRIDGTADPAADLHRRHERPAQPRPVLQPARHTLPHHRLGGPPDRPKPARPDHVEMGLRHLDDRTAGSILTAGAGAFPEPAKGCPARTASAVGVEGPEGHVGTQGALVRAGRHGLAPSFGRHLADPDSFDPRGDGKRRMAQSEHHRHAGRRMRLPRLDSSVGDDVDAGAATVFVFALAQQ